MHLRYLEPRWWERGLPYSHAYCPTCQCNKSGDVTEPNAITEACADANCECH